MLFIEALLDSAVVKKSRGEIDRGEESWMTARTLADAYAELFGDDYYLERTLRYRVFTSEALQQAADLLELKNASRSHLYRGDFQLALDSFHQALGMAEKIGAVDDEATLIGNIGAAEFYLGNFDAALNYYRKSVSLLEKLGDQRRIGNQLGNIANVYSDKSDYPTALSYFDKAVVIRKELDDKRGLAADMNNMGLVYEEMGQYDAGLKHYQLALKLNRAIDNNRGIAYNLGNIANVHINLGDYPDAIRIYDEALTLRRAQGDLAGEGNDLGNLGEVYKSLGDHEKAMGLFQQALTIHRDQGYREGEAYQLGRIARLYRLEGDYARAVVTYQDALDIHREIGHARGEATWLTALGETYAEIGDYRHALENLQLALELHRRIGNRSGEAATLRAIGYVELKNDKVQRAKENFNRALSIHAQQGERSAECLLLSNLAYTYGLEADSLGAVTTWRKAFHMAEELGEKRLQGWIKLLSGDFFQANGASEEADEAYEQGLAISERLVDPELRWQLYYGRGQLWEKQGKMNRAFYSYQAAVEIIEEIRSKAMVEEMRSGVIHNRFDAYEAITLLLIRMGRVEDAFEYVERARSRSLLDVLGNARIPYRNSENQRLIEKEQALRSKISTLILQISKPGPTEEGVRGHELYRSDLERARREYQRVLVDLKLRNPEYAAMVSVDPLSVSEITQLIDEDTALLEYFVTSDYIGIFVVTNRGVNSVGVHEGHESLHGKIALFRGTAVHQMDEEMLHEQFWARPLSRLYDLLIAPVEMAGYLAGKTHLVIVTTGLLSYLPFQALVTELKAQEDELAQPHFLVEDYTISYAPSASSLKFFMQKDRLVSGSMLLLAPQNVALPMSGEEVKEIAQTFGIGAEYYLAEEATETLVKAKGSKYDVLHFATTAHFNKANPLFSSLQLASSDEDDGNLEVHEILAMDLNASVVTLSACQTALGSGFTAALPHGDDLAGLTRAFLYAGSPAVVASLWEVADASTSLFMVRFYKYLLKLNTAEALALTQRDMLKGKIGPSSGNADYSHPYFWAPFILVGNWK